MGSAADKQLRMVVVLATNEERYLFKSHFGGWAM